MSGKALEAVIVHGRIRTCEGTELPEQKGDVRDPLKQEPALKVIFLEDPTLPLDPDGWPEDDRW